MTYQQRILDAYNAGVFKAGELYVTEIQHGPKCRWTEKNPTCTCYPAIQAVSDTEVLSIGSDGWVLERRLKC